MTRKQRRALFIAVGITILALAAGLVLYAMRDNIVFFYSPSEITEKGVEPGQRFRLGGLVEQGSLKHSGSATYAFVVTDFESHVEVRYTGILPDLFREGQGVVAEGRLSEEGVFVADNVLAKHDEKYMPPEVAAALRKSGDWQGEDAEVSHSETYGQGAYP